MSNISHDDRSGSKKIIWGLVFIGFGIWMICDPTMMDGASSSNGNKAAYKMILALVWGRTFGFIAIPIGLYLAFKGVGQMNLDDN